jgi:hypothetical protein
MFACNIPQATYLIVISKETYPYMLLASSTTLIFFSF